MAISKIESAALASGVPSRSQLPAGTVLQVVTANFSSILSTTSSSYVDSGISVSITPTSSSSKILILPAIQTGAAGSSGINSTAFFNVCRNSTQLLEVATRTYDYGAGVYIDTPGSMVYLDSPSTASSVTYKIQFKTPTSTAFINGDTNGPSSLTLMEIAA